MVLGISFLTGCGPPPTASILPLPSNDCLVPLVFPSVEILLTHYGSCIGLTCRLPCHTFAANLVRRLFHARRIQEVHPARKCSGYGGGGWVFVCLCGGGR